MLSDLEGLAQVFQGISKIKVAQTQHLLLHSPSSSNYQHPESLLPGSYQKFWEEGL